jgi:hypothetical protein
MVVRPLRPTRLELVSAAGFVPCTRCVQAADSALAGLQVDQPRGPERAIVGLRAQCVYGKAIRLA